MSIDAYALAVLPLPHELRRGISVRFARQGDVLVLSDGHCALGGLDVQYVRRHLKKEEQELAEGNGEQ